MPDPPSRFTVFANAATDVAGYVVRGLAKADAVDALYEMAEASGLTQPNQDDIQTIISDAFRRAEEQAEYVLDDPRVDQQQRPTNGRAPHQPPALQPPRILTKADFIKGFIPPDYLIEGLLQKRFIYSLTGQTGHAKTAVALLLARLVSCQDYNTTLGPHRVDKGRVIYFVGENPDDVRMRVIGSDAQRNDEPQADNITFIPGIFNIEQMLGVLDGHIRQSGDVSLIIVDTSAAYFLGNEELSNTQMGGYARVLRRLTTLPGGPTVLVLCHPIKHVLEPSQLLPRGGGAYLAEMDGNFTLWRLSDTVVELYYNKIRGPGFQPISFRLETIRTSKLVDRKGRQISTVQAVPITQREEDAQVNQEETDENHVLAAMLKITDGSFAKWAEHLGWVSDGGPNKKKVERIIGAMSAQKPRLTRKERRHWVLTEEGKEQARAAALRFEREALAADQRSMEF